MIRVLAVDRPRWSSGDASFVVDLFESTGAENVDARRVRGTVDLRFSDVEHENAFDEPRVCAYLRNLFERAPWAGYYLLPSSDQLTMFVMAHGASLGSGDGQQLIVAPEIVATFRSVMLASAIYAVEHGDDWRQVVENWPTAITGSLAYDVRDVLAEMFDRHAGLRLTSDGWVGPDA